MTPAWNFHLTLQEQALPPPATLLDVGANRSQMSRLLRMSCPVAPRQLSFEPNPDMHPEGEVFRYALSDADGEVQLFLPDDEEGWGTIEPQKEIIHGHTRHFPVPAARFDSLVRRGELNPAEFVHPVMAKIDTEGSEQKVLRGFGGELRHVDYLLIEVENTGFRGKDYNLLTLSAHLHAEGFRHSKILFCAYDGPTAPGYSDIFFWR